MSEDKPKVDVNVVQVVGSALAAVSSAVLLSTVGVAGTLIGAAAGSVIATVGGALYSYSLDVSKRRVAAAAQLAAAARVRRGEGPGQRVTSQEPTQRLATKEPAQSQQATHQGPAEQPDAAPGVSGWREALARLNWKRVALAALGVFLAAMTLIVAFELVAGRPVSTFTGGTDTARSGTTLGGSDKPATTPSPSPTTSSDAPTEPTQSPTETPEESESVVPSESVAPTATPTPEPSVTEAPTEAPSVSVSATPAG